MSELGYTVLENRLSKLDSQNQRRSLVMPVGEAVDLTSNDYLGFSTDPVLQNKIYRAVKGIPTGSAGSRLLRGELPIYREVEKHLAEFVGRKSALLFPSGYQANLALLSTLLRPADQVFSDSLNHASIIDGIKLSKAECFIYSHKNCSVLENLLRLHPQSRKESLRVIVTESLFSMDGDMAPLERLAEISEKYDCLLVVDEAHATGLFGYGAGLVSQMGLANIVFATVHTGGKALGVGGAWVAGEVSMKEYLVNFARPFIFSTAPIPTLAVALVCAVEFYRDLGEQRTATVLANSRYLKKELGKICSPKGIIIPADVAGPILPVILGSNERALKFARTMQSLGYDIRAIRPPTVRRGESRLRLTVTWGVSRETLQKFVEDFEEHCL